MGFSPCCVRMREAAAAHKTEIIIIIIAVATHRCSCFKGEIYKRIDESRARACAMRVCKACLVTVPTNAYMRATSVLSKSLGQSVEVFLPLQVHLAIQPRQRLLCSIDGFHDYVNTFHILQLLVSLSWSRSARPHLQCDRGHAPCRAS